MLIDKNVSFIWFGQVPPEDEKHHRPQGLDADSQPHEGLCKRVNSFQRLLVWGLRFFPWGPTPGPSGQHSALNGPWW